jgi:hypothetical protein
MCRQRDAHQIEENEKCSENTQRKRRRVMVLHPINNVFNIIEKR